MWVLVCLAFIQANIHPAIITAEVSTEAVFECLADGYQPHVMFGYQWIFNGTVIPNATNDMLILTSVYEDKEGSYECVVTNYWNITAKSTAAQLTVTSNE